MTVKLSAALFCILYSIMSVNTAPAQTVHDKDLKNKESYKQSIISARQYEEMHRSGAVYSSELKKGPDMPQKVLLPDADNDGMPDAWETANSLNPNDEKDAWTDNDVDNVLNLFEYQLNSNPNSSATPLTTNVAAGANISTAINSAPAGRLLRVQGTTFNVHFYTPVPKTIMIQGGWNSTFTSRDPVNMPTIFNGQNTSGEVLFFDFKYGNSNVVLDGINVINGRGYSSAVFIVTDSIAVSNFCLHNCSITNSKTIFSFGGALAISHWDGSTSEIFISNTVISGDSCSGIYNQTTDGSVAEWHIINSTFTNNFSLDVNEGYGIEAFTSSAGTSLTVELKNIIAWGNELAGVNFDKNFGSVSLSVTATHSDIDSVIITGGATFTPITGMIDANPLFVNPLSDYHLTASSPCINTGVNAGLPYFGPNPDMGAYEFGLTAVQGISDEVDFSIYPNPSDGLFTISLSSDYQGTLIQVYDVTGKIVYTDEDIENRKYEMDLSLCDKGIYILKINNNGLQQVVKLIVF